MTNAARGLERDEWLTRDRLAELMGKDPDTVRRAEKQHSLQTWVGCERSCRPAAGRSRRHGQDPGSTLDPVSSAKEAADAMALRCELEPTRAERSELAGLLAGYEQHGERADR